MKTLTGCVLALLLIVAQAGAQSKHIHEETDPYTGLRALFLETSTHTCPGDASRGAGDPDLHLLFVAVQNPDHTLSYYLTPEMDGGDYTLGLRPKDTMDALIDGQAFTLTTYMGSNATRRHSNSHESIPFTVAETDLDRLSRAKAFQFRINSAKVGLQRCSDTKRLRDLAEFLVAAKAYGLPETGSNSATESVMEHFDPSTKLKSVSMDAIPTEACPGDPALGPGDANVHLIFSANQRSNGGVWYFLATELSGGTPLGLHRGDKLHTQIGAVSGSFNTINGSVLSTRTDLRGNSVMEEKTAFHVHQGDLVPLTSGPGLELRIEGANGVLHRCASADKFQHVGEFIQVAATYHASR